MPPSFAHNKVVKFMPSPQVEAAKPRDPSDVGKIFLEALSAHIFGELHEETPHQQAQTLSYALRKAFQFSTNSIHELPLQLGQDHNRAKAYLETAIAAWSDRDDMYALFRQLDLEAADCTVFIEHVSKTIVIDDLAIWLCTEFGHIRTKRQALHCRRYLAANLTKQILGDTDRPRTSTTLSPEDLQARLNEWSNPVVPVKESLHYQQVILPVFKRIREIFKTETTPV